MKRTLFALSLLLAACTMEPAHVADDAAPHDATLPACPSEPCFCHQDGVCSCPLPDGGHVECQASKDPRIDASTADGG
jgi:hypothetical protein